MTYHFIITMAGRNTYCWRGEYEARPGETRAHATGWLIEETKRRATAEGKSLGEAAVVLFFSLEPNELPGGAQ